MLVRKARSSFEALSFLAGFLEVASQRVDPFNTGSAKHISRQVPGHEFFHRMGSCAVWLTAHLPVNFGFVELVARLRARWTPPEGIGARFAAVTLACVVGTACGTVPKCPPAEPLVSRPPTEITPASGPAPVVAPVVMETIRRAFPTAPPPTSCWSSNGRVYLAWTFARGPEACGSLNAYPFKLAFEP